MDKHRDNKIKESGLTWADESEMWQATAGEDTIKHLGQISKKEYDYYHNSNQNKKGIHFGV